jgi:molybdenum cofactor cytidylyltransferase
VVVASHGHFEVEALEWALRRELAYVGLVSSRRRWPDVRERLTRLGLGAQAARVHAPAGLALGAARPEEVALSVLSQIVAERRGGSLGPAGAAVGGSPAAAAMPASRAVSVAGPGAASGSAVSCCSVAAGETLEAGESEAESCCGAPSRAPQQSLTEPRFAALVLAAGLSRRMGAPNKLLLSFAGEPLIVRSVRTVLHTGFDQIVVVLGHQAQEVGRALEPLGVRSVLNPDFETGQVSSVRAGLAALVPPVDAVMICLGDQPLLEVSDLGALKRAFRERPHGSIVVPTHGESRGNPVVIDWASAEETLKRGTNYGCRHFLDENPERVYRWPAPSDHFLRDLDVPGDLQPLLDRARA